jgi:hypothetical protein
MTTLELPLARAETPLPTWTKILCALFFCSGFPALIYQLTWQRELFRIFGVNSESVTIVVTAFMLGLGLGSLAGGWLSKRQGISLLPLLAAIEIATAAFGIVSLYVFEQMQWPANILAEEFQPAEDVDVAPDGGEVEAIARANIAVCGITIVQSNIDGKMLLHLGR